MRSFEYFTLHRDRRRDILLKCKSFLRAREISSYLDFVGKWHVHPVTLTRHRQEGVVRNSTVCTDLMWHTRR